MSDAGEYQDSEVYPGLWECGTCHAITDVSHYVEDRMTGTMAHAADAERRAAIGARCGWSSTYGGYHDPPIRCARRHGHSGSHDPQIHGFGGFTERYGGAIPPARPMTDLDYFGHSGSQPGVSDGE